MKPTLFVLAAGMGSRYGGLKQLDGLGPNGETIMDYSIFDAIRGGFGKVVFVIRKDFEADFLGSMITHTIRFLRGGLRTIRFSSEGGFACLPQRLHPSTGTSVAPRWFHCSVSTSPHAAVTEY